MKVNNASALTHLDVVLSSAFRYVANTLFIETNSGWRDVRVISREECPDRDCAHDASRGQAKFVVIGLPMNNGGGCTSHAQEWPYVMAQRLNDDGTHNPEGEIIAFALGEHYDAIADVEVVGKMRLVAAQ